ncbi:hypothetical protein BDV41DRAFT_552867 [Aspergillus transmontanensis]|uniref:Uncharacterized protein n=1 Tax=Aspergillus transmontanensis TaxID=1034304 RepID=A0A5N6VHL0_9EURO|nr:hypothetical protein BDV41DRAFT_552867 [Aspergillus transmontanensis]
MQSRILLVGRSQSLWGDCSQILRRGRCPASRIPDLQWSTHCAIGYIRRNCNMSRQ